MIYLLVSFLFAALYSSCHLGHLRILVLDTLFEQVLMHDGSSLEITLRAERRKLELLEVDPRYASLGGGGTHVASVTETKSRLRSNGVQGQCCISFIWCKQQLNRSVCPSSGNQRTEGTLKARASRTSIQTIPLAQHANQRHKEPGRKNTA
ncbi:hypothetical protein B0H15DRAFT_845174 [Mycena belliarum]|uniref:Secreted protein n=1 Tax=Mycena belliarum TaxID=1033014 RepID=A0AAD6XQU4_9AGAR|nr:hypothetical protein B0H15DRAFT_845174 [Mycena belliae]